MVAGQEAAQDSGLAARAIGEAAVLHPAGGHAGGQGRPAHQQVVHRVVDRIDLGTERRQVGR